LNDHQLDVLVSAFNDVHEGLAGQLQGVLNVKIWLDIFLQELDDLFAVSSQAVGLPLAAGAGGVCLEEPWVSVAVEAGNEG
jgi:hypothetical protein